MTEEEKKLFKLYGKVPNMKDHAARSLQVIVQKILFPFFFFFFFFCLTPWPLEAPWNQFINTIDGRIPNFLLSTATQIL
jgi:hypothetical protein